MWLYKGVVLDESIIDDKATGFIYIITNLIDGRKYVGRKLLDKAGYKTVKGKKKKIRKPNGWQDYFSSSKEIADDIERLGRENFKREIIHFCNSASELMYVEEKLQYSFGVLESDKWYNANIRTIIQKKNIIKLNLDLNKIIDNYK